VERWAVESQARSFERVFGRKLSVAESQPSAETGPAPVLEQVSA
jgi:hypothetical protein